MAGVVLENLSTKKLVCILFFLCTLQLIGFIVGGLKVPPAVHFQVTLGSYCWDNSTTSKHGGVEWFEYPRPNGTLKQQNTCVAIPDGLTNHEFMDKNHISAKDVVITFRYPLPRDNRELRMSRWFMYHVAVLNFRVTYKDSLELDHTALNMRVSVGSKVNGSKDWQEVLNGHATRYLTCEKPEKVNHDYNCNVMDLFELSDMHDEQYLINIRMPPNVATGENMFMNLYDLELIWFAQTGGFTLYFLSLKTVFFALVLPALIWNWKRVVDLNRPTTFLEKMLIGLALSAVLLNFPVDWLALVIKMPFMLLWSDIRQGLFLAILLAYWLVFTGEHLVDNTAKGEWKSYWKHLVTVITASAFMLIFDLCERGIRMVNPLFSIWATSTGTQFAKAFIGLAMAAAIIYFLILLGLVIKSLVTIWRKRATLHKLSRAVQVHYKSLIQRFFFMLIYSLVCCALTVIAFALGQVYENQWRWRPFSESEQSEITDYRDKKTEEAEEFEVIFELSSAFQLGVYTTWNVYVLVMLIFYAPSHKKNSNLTVTADDNSDAWETVELTERSSTSFIRQRATAAPEDNDETAETPILGGDNNSEQPQVVASNIHTLAN